MDFSTARWTDHKFSSDGFVIVVRWAAAGGVRMCVCWMEGRKESGEGQKECLLWLDS